MRKLIKQAGLQSPSHFWIIVLRCLILVALGFTGYLAGLAISGNSIPGCGPESGCNQVMQTRWASWFGIPVTVPAFLVYAVALLATFQVTSQSSSIRLTGWRLLVPCALIIGAASAWFLLLQALVIKLFCFFCTLVDLCGITVAGLSLLRAPNGALRRGSSDAQVLSRPAAIKLSLVAVGLFLVMVGGQILHEPQLYRVKTIGGQSGSGRDSQRQVDIFNGQYRFALHQVPLIGDPMASNVVVLLFDYTCVTCRAMHEPLMQVQKQLVQELAIVALPVPFEPACNPLLKEAHPDHANACEYARLALAVWNIAPEKFKEFDAWMFATATSVPSVPDARQFASQLAGASKLELALQDPRLDQTIKTNVQVFYSSVLMGNPSLPQVISGNRIGSGVFRGVDDIYGVLNQLLGLKRPR